MRVARAVDDRPLRVALVVGTLQRAGVERQVVLLSEALGVHHIESSVAAIQFGGPYVDDLRVAGVPVFLGRIGNRFRPLTIAKGIYQYARWLRTTRPDVVHAFLFHPYVLTSALMPVVGRPALVLGKRNLAAGKPQWMLRLDRFANRRARVIVCNARAVVDDVIRIEKAPPERCRLIHNGVGENYFVDRSPHAGPVRIICVANLTPVKNHQLLIAAAEQLAARGISFELILVGEGPLVTQLRAQAATSGATITFLGGRDDVPALLASADIAALASNAEGFSNAIVEAMAAGLPVVATDVGGNGEALGDCGVLVPRGALQPLVDALEALIRDPERRAELGRRARERAHNEFGVSAMVRAHVELYREVAA
jgi:glycosyltransferase involved in cell wall biosynthesis